MPDFIDHLTDAQTFDLVELYQQEWWSVHRQVEDVKVMLKNSDLIFGFQEGERLIGFARVLSDFVYKALLFDILIAVDQRGQGLGKKLMTTILEYPKLAHTSHFELYCLPAMESFYRPFGFITKAREAELSFMRYSRPK